MKTLTSGTGPMMLGWYYAASALICGAIALSIGSSWTTAGTIGVGLVGIAGMLGVSPAITAGAVISGAYLGDKLSPLSETTILTAQMVNVDVYEHIKRQAWTSVPAFVLAFVLFMGLGLVSGPQVNDTVPSAVELRALGDIYAITFLNLLPLVLLVVLSIRKAPASLALMTAAIVAGILGAILQPGVMRDFADRPDLGRCSRRSTASGRRWPMASRSTPASARSTSCCPAAG